MKTTLKEKIAYRFDNYIAKGAFSIFMAMLIVFFIGVGLLSVFKIIFEYFATINIDIGRDIWNIFLQSTDPGNMAQDNESIWYIKIIAIALKKPTFLFRDDFRKCTDSEQYPLNLMLFAGIPEKEWKEYFYLSIDEIIDKNKALYKWSKGII